jgi:hypothetical protein
MYKTVQSLCLFTLLSASCGDSAAPSIEKPDVSKLDEPAEQEPVEPAAELKTLIDAASRGDGDAMEELKSQVTKAAEEIKAGIEKDAAAGDEKALLAKAWLEGGES